MKTINDKKTELILVLISIIIGIIYYISYK